MFVLVSAPIFAEKTFFMVSTSTFRSYSSDKTSPFTVRFRQWLCRPLSHLEHLIVNAFETQRTLTGHVRFLISDSGTRGYAIRRAIILYMRYIVECVNPGTSTAVFARTLTESRRADIPNSLHGSAFAPSRLQGIPFTNALILDASSYPRWRGAGRTDVFPDILRAVTSIVPLSGSVVIIHGDAFVRGHSQFKYEFFRTVKAAGTTPFIAVAASRPLPGMSRRRTADGRIKALAAISGRVHIWDRPIAEIKDYYSTFCRHDTTYPEFVRRIHALKAEHFEKLAAEKANRRQLRDRRRQLVNWESIPARIPAFEDLASGPSLLCLSGPAAESISGTAPRNSLASPRYSTLDSVALIRLCAGRDRSELADKVIRTYATSAPVILNALAPRRSAPRNLCGHPRPPLLHIAA